MFNIMWCLISVELAQLRNSLTYMNIIRHVYRRNENHIPSKWDPCELIMNHLFPWPLVLILQAIHSLAISLQLSLMSKEQCGCT